MHGEFEFSVMYICVSSLTVLMPDIAHCLLLLCDVTVMFVALFGVFSLPYSPVYMW